MEKRAQYYNTTIKIGICQADRLAQLDHHDADGLADHKAWRTTQTIMRRYKCSLLSTFNILYMGPLFYGEIC
jgi:hypothetical protein